MPDAPQPSVEATMSHLAEIAARRRRRFRVAAICLLLAAATAAVFWFRNNKETPVHFQTRAVRSGDLTVTVTATGNLAATNQVEVGSELSGIITTMTADYNDTVQAGQPLAYMDDAKYAAAVIRSRAELAAAEANYREAAATRKAGEKKLQRYRQTRELTSGKLPSTDDMEQAEADLERAVAAEDAAAAAINSARASLTSNEADLKKTVIYAPINGIVLSRDVEPGQTVAASLQAPVLYTLAEDLRRMELQVDVDEADVGQVRSGQPATFTVDAYPERTFEARITQVRYGAETTDGVVTYKAVLSVENPDLLLRPGMTATADIVVRNVTDSLLVPNAALRFSPPRQAADRSDRRSLLESLLPRPPRHRAGSRQTDETASATGNQGTVWILENNRPVRLTVEKIATDGATTAVRASELRAGMGLIVNAVTTGS